MTDFEEVSKALMSQKKRAKAAFEKGKALEDLLFLEYARALCSGGISSEVGELRALFSVLRQECADEDGMLPTPFLYRAALVFLQEVKKRLGVLPLPEEFGAGFPQREKICYIKNHSLQQVADASGIDAQWFYAEDFESACREVSDGVRDACLLPYLDDRGQPMPGFTRLISEYGLKKRRLFLLEEEDRPKGYLLLSSCLSGTDPASVLEFQLFPESVSLIWEAEKLCLALGGACALPVPLLKSEEEGSSSLSCILRVSGEKKVLLDALFGVGLLIPDMGISGFYDRKFI